MTPLGQVPGFSDSSPFGINNNGWIVGQVVEVNFFHAFVYRDGTMTDLNDLLPPGSLWELVQANDVNDAGQIVGYGFVNGDTPERAFLFNNGVVTDLGTLRGDWSVAFAVNSSGLVVGESENGDGEAHAFIWDSGVMTQVGPFSTGNYSIALDVNDAGTVVGSFGNREGAGGSRFPFSWESGVVSELDLSDTFSTGARAVSNAGQVVGFGTRADVFLFSVAILWENGVPYELYDLIPSGSNWLMGLGSAIDINEDGDIAGDSYFSPGDGNAHAYLLTPIVPIPALSEWGVLVIAMVILVAGTVILRCRRSLPVGAAIAVALLGASDEGWAEPAVVPSAIVSVSIDSGTVSASGGGTDPVVIYCEVVEETNAQWLRLHFAQVILSGAPATGDESFLRLTSVEDSAVQTMSTDALTKWINTTAYFNGDQVLVELVAYSGTGTNSVTVDLVRAGTGPGEDAEGICHIDDGA